MYTLMGYSYYLQFYVHNVCLSNHVSKVGVIKIVILINCNLITFSKVIACNCN